MKILVVEDDKRVSDFLSRGLKEEGYSVTTTYDGPEALEYVRSERYDLMILDLLIPGIDGIALCRELRSHGNEIPIIMLTAMDSLDDRLEGFAAGTDDYISKPFAFEEVLARIRALLRRNSNKRAKKILRCGTIELDTFRHRVKVENEPIDLTTKEYMLLELFLSHPGRVYSHAAILQHVWGFNDYPETNIIDVYIHRLRKKLNSTRKSTVIRTVRGFGYTLDHP